jgi:hypothetical protein
MQSPTTTSAGLSLDGALFPVAECRTNAFIGSDFGQSSSITGSYGSALGRHEHPHSLSFEKHVRIPAPDGEWNPAILTCDFGATSDHGGLPELTHP